MWRHVLPNAMVATLTFMPFILTGSIVTTLTSLDFLGFGLPPGSPSLGELLAQGKNNLQAPWLGLTGFFVLALMLSLLIFIGEAVRDAFDPRKTVPVSGRRGADRMRLLEVERPLGRASSLGGAAAARTAVRSVAFSHRSAARPWRWWARAARASRSPRFRSCSCCPTRALRIRAGSIRSRRAASWSAPTSTRCARCAATASA